MQREIIDIFKGIGKIPRKSGHEEKISLFLAQKAEGLGLKTVRDTVGNVIVEKPASVGRENDPAVILQAHMDMVCVADEDKVYDPLKDGISVKEWNGYLTAEGTTLGADDGIGVAAILYLLQADFSHGPLRAIFTVDEEEGMNGARELDAAHLQADYLINCDSEDFDRVTVSSAGSVNIDFIKKINREVAADDTGMALEIKGLCGGHSGMDINVGKANAVKVLAIFLQKLKDSGISFGLADINGGTARNAIPDSARAVISLEGGQKEKIKHIQAEMNVYLNEVFGGVDEGAQVVVKAIDAPDAVMDKSSAENIVHLLTVLHTGVYSVADRGKSVESSGNIGVVETDEREVKVKFFPRSTKDEEIEIFKLMGKSLGNGLGFDVSISSQSPAWPEKRTGRLATLVCESFSSLTGKPMIKESIHAGLECSFFHQKNKQLDMVSIGPTVLDVHSPKERLKLDTLGIHVETIKNVLEKISLENKP